MKTTLLLYFAFAMLLIPSCSSKQVYEGLRDRQRVECQQLPKSEYEECLERVDMSYEEYRRKRGETQEGE